MPIPFPKKCCIIVIYLVASGIFSFAQNWDKNCAYRIFGELLDYKTVISGSDLFCGKKVEKLESRLYKGFIHFYKQNMISIYTICTSVEK